MPFTLLDSELGGERLSGIVVKYALLFQFTRQYVLYSNTIRIDP